MSRPLKRQACQTCGHGFHAIQPTAEDLLEIYGKSYSIGLRNTQAVHERALAYNSQISGALRSFLGSDLSLSSLVEFGSGSGDLLNCLAQEWKCQIVTGVEPSSQLVEHSRRHAAAGTRIEECFAEAFDPQGIEYDFCVSVNVVEHAASPTTYLRSCRNAISQDGIIVVICPDGEIASSELLFYDHISSFTVRSMELCAAEMGVGVVASLAMTGPLRGFRIYLMRLGVEQGDLPSIAGSELTKARTQFLENWREMESSVLEAFGESPYAIFGTGEFADLLAAYSPGVVERACSFVVDTPIEEAYHGKPVTSTDQFLLGGQRPLLAAVNLHSWPELRNRFNRNHTAIFHPYELAQERERT